jgi:riboflavin synthase
LVFTGLVRTTGRVVSVHAGAQARRFAIASDLAAADLELGASVCCAGVCLTVVASQAGRFEVDAAFETLRCTTLGALCVGARINLEPSLRVGDAMGGHFVSGHVDGVGTVRSVTARGDAVEFWIDIPASLLPLVAAKGSICVDGTSLTVNTVDANGAMIGLVPHTLAVTTLGELTKGDAINLEVDLLARYVARLLETRGSAPPDVTVEMLAAAGFRDTGGPT